MKAKDFAFVGAKIVGIILFIKGMEMMVNSIKMLVIHPYPTGSNPFSSFSIFNFLLSAIILNISIILWGSTGKILKYLLPKDKNNNHDSVSEEKVELHDLQIAAFTVVGLIILSDAIPKIFYAASEILVEKDLYFPIYTNGRVNPLSFQLLTKIIGHLVYLFIGIYLLFGFKNFLSIIRKGLSKLRRDIDLEDKNEDDDSDAHKEPGTEE